MVRYKFGISILQTSVEGEKRKDGRQQIGRLKTNVIVGIIPRPKHNRISSDTHTRSLKNSKTKTTQCRKRGGETRSEMAIRIAAAGTTKRNAKA